MDELERVMGYVRAERQARGDPERVGSFAVYLHPSRDGVEDNVAMPDTAAVGDAGTWSGPLRQSFAARGRVPVVQWLDAWAPQLATTLRRAGFGEHARETVLICAADGARPVAAGRGLTFVTLTAASSLAEVRENLDTNELGFDPSAMGRATDEQAEQFRSTLDTARAFTARLDGQAAGAGMFTTPRRGVAELVGIATLERFRGRGIAAALTSYIARAAFAQGCDLIFLRTANAAARRAYERAGFRPRGAFVTCAMEPLGADAGDT